MSGIDQLAGSWSGSGDQDAKTFTGAIVTGVNPDGTVDVRYLGEDHAGIESLASYTNRLVGDNVMIRDSGSRWTIMGKIGGEQTGVPNISWGNGNPVGADWSAAAASIKVRPGQVYIQGTAFASAQATPQAIVPPDGDRAFQGGTWNHSFSGRPVQGIETLTGLYGSGAWSGGWFYDTDLQAAIAAKAVRSVELRLERGGEPNLGLDEPVIPVIYIHNATAGGASEPSQVAGPYNATALAIGQSAWWQVPQPVVDMFTANTAKGFMIKASTTEEFLVMAEYAGDVRITN